MTCTVSSCERKPVARGLCGRHYQRWRKFGDPLKRKSAANGEPLEYLQRIAASPDTSECIRYPFGIDPNGYGANITFNGRSQRPHRVVCHLRHGPPPTPSHEAAHSCGKGHEACIHPNHLRWATGAENCADKVDHGTDNRGERSATRKISAEQVLEIRALAGTISQREIATRFSISQANVSMIVTGRNWRTEQSNIRAAERVR